MLEIRLYPPNPEDPGQLSSCFQQLSGLLDQLLLRPRAISDISSTHSPFKRPAERNNLPKIRIIFVQYSPTPTRGLWVPSPNSWQQSVSSASMSPRRPLQTHITRLSSESDLAIMLSQVTRWRSCECVEIRVPTGSGKHVWKSMQGCEVQRLVNEVTAGIDVHQTDSEGEPAKHFEEKCVREPQQEHIKEPSYWHIWLDYNLDSLPGPCAANLRYERCMNWCEGYEFNLATLLLGDQNITDLEDTPRSNCGLALFNGQLQRTILQALRKRFKALFAFNAAAVWNSMYELDDNALTA